MLSNLEIFEHLKYLDWLVHKYNQIINKDNKDQYDVTRGQGKILANLLLEDSISTKDLAKRTGVHVSSLNEMLAKLERKGLVKRIPYPKDKRIIVNCITDKAKNHRPKLDLACFNCLSKEEKLQFNELIEKISENIEENINSLGNEEFRFCYQKRKNSFEMFLEKIRNQEQKENYV